MSKLEDTLSFIVGTGVGLVTGGIVAAWMSPHKGEENREELQRIVITFRTRTQNRFQDVTHQIQSALPIGKTTEQSAEDE